MKYLGKTLSMLTGAILMACIATTTFAEDLKGSRSINVSANDFISGLQLAHTENIECLERATAKTDSAAQKIDLDKAGIKPGMTLPDDGRTLLHVVQLDQLSEAGIRLQSPDLRLTKVDLEFKNVDLKFQDDIDCICICGSDGCTPSSCGHCPVPLCPGGYLPPCPDGGAALPGIRGVLSPHFDTPKR